MFEIDSHSTQPNKNETHQFPELINVVFFLSRYILNEIFWFHDIERNSFSSNLHGDRLNTVYVFI